MLAALTGFVGELRRTGIAVALPELRDAAAALRAVPVDDRRALHSALSATLVKHPAHGPAFDTLFELWFAPRPGSGDAATRGIADLSDPELTAALVAALDRGDQLTARRIAAVAVDRFAGVEPGRAVAGRIYVRRAATGLDVDAVRVTLAAALGAGSDPTTAAARRAAAEAAERVTAFGAELERRVRTLLVADRGAAAVAQTLRPVLPTSVDLMDARPDQLEQLDRLVGPLAAALTARMRAHRRVRGTRLDVRATVRRSLSSGGVLTDLRFRRPRPPRQDLLVLADVSGSMSRFSGFALTLLHAMSGAFPRLRCFAFLDEVADVTGAVRAARTPGEAAALINADPALVWLDGRSDYGHVLTSFAARHGATVTGNTTVLVLGDARSNHQAPRADALRDVGRRARAVHWLNPEPARYWNTGDSVLAEYAPHCTGVHECRNLDQLRTFVEALGV